MGIPPSSHVDPIEFVLPVCLRQLFPVDISVLRVLSYRRCFRICCFPIGILVFQQVKHFEVILSDPSREYHRL